MIQDFKEKSYVLVKKHSILNLEKSRIKKIDDIYYHVELDNKLMKFFKESKLSEEGFKLLPFDKGYKFIYLALKKD